MFIQFALTFMFRTEKNCLPWIQKVIPTLVTDLMLIEGTLVNSGAVHLQLRRGLKDSEREKE